MTETPETESPPADTRRVVRWAGLGAVSGLAATLSIFVPQWIGFYGEAEIDLGPVGLFVSPLSLGPGLVFGLIVGYALRRAGLAGGRLYPAFIAASTFAYFAAVQISLNVLVDVIDNIAAVGIIAGLFGAALLTAISAALMPAFRRRRPVIATIAAGGILGALLYIPIEQDHFLYWLALYAPWQAGYTAAMATAPPAEPETR